MDKAETLAWAQGQEVQMDESGCIHFSRIEELIYGRSAADVLPGLLSRLGAERVFLIVSGTLSRETDEVSRLCMAIGGKCVDVFDSVPSHSPRKAVVAATSRARDCKADLIVTLGGGSVTDAAKAVQLCLANNITSIESISTLQGNIPQGANALLPEMLGPKVRQISIPTTLSAGEFSASAGITNEQTRKKEVLRHPDIVPRVVILDPIVTRHTPMWLWNSTGIRAVDHCVEGYCSREANAYGDAAALHALTLLTRGLRRVKEDPLNTKARSDCQLGSSLSMAPLNAGVPMGASHGIGYVLGAMFGVPHGYTSCIMLPAVMRWNRPVNAERQAEIAAAMGSPGEDAADIVSKLIAELGLPHSLAEFNIGPKDLDTIAQNAMETAWVPKNPRRIEGPGDVREILEMTV